MPEPLRVVGDDETPKRRRKLTISQAADRGSLRDQLVALRGRVAKAVEDPKCPPRDLASLSRRLIEIGKEIAAIDAQADEEGGGAAATPDAEWEAI